MTISYENSMVLGRTKLIDINIGQWSLQKGSSAPFSVQVREEEISARSIKVAAVCVILVGESMI